ncbi:M23 family metallopeptidase [Trueperella bialowiezensis]|uniref:Putative peptidase n=1 Tax=Trueperella bialowiezensis TaxID=312285 RepID=A0A448PCM3_9ACTO|nr:M23 family metallopeptidase [Trueperella bialowiezensis]VEI12684.1 putative peptidase [Trueperella bialowiezensis]
MKKLALSVTALALGALGVAAVYTPGAPARVLDSHQTITVITDQSRAPVDYDWPSGAEVPVLRPFYMDGANWNPGHRGVDLALDAGQSVYAAADGTVIYSGWLNDRQLVSIEHADGIRTTYEPLIPAVRRGQDVTRGEVIGYVDGTHCAPLPCLHWGAKRGSSDYIDPLTLLQRAPIRLLE